MHHKYVGSWKGIDRGREGLLDPSVWQGILEVLSSHEGTEINDPDSKMYSELDRRYPEIAWISPKDPQHNFFRDYQTPWTLSGVLVPTRDTGGRIRLTDLGHALIDGKLSTSAVLTQAMASHVERGGGKSFSILAAAFLALPSKSFTIEQLYYGVERGWRPADSAVPSLSGVPSSVLAEDLTPVRRLRAMLKLLSSVEALYSDGVRWKARNVDILQAIAQGNVIQPPSRPAKSRLPTSKDTPLEKELAQFAELEDESAAPIRDLILRTIAVRRGQPRFRRALLGLYDQKCAISRWDAPVALEAAHISPVASSGTHAPSNGMLLRADLHTLFDLHYISVDPSTYSVAVSRRLMRTRYADFDGETLHLPLSVADQPSRSALAEHYGSFVKAK
jgi:hypothetical protein